MADTVKTLLLQAIADRLGEIPEVATVYRGRKFPPPPELTDLPALYFWEEEQQEAFNRLVKGNLKLWVQVFFSVDPEDLSSFTAFTEAAEEVAGQISNIFAEPGSLRAAGLLQADPPQVDKAAYNSAFGILIMQFKLSYAHAFGDAFTG